MNAATAAPPFRPFYLPAEIGERYCLFHPPGVPARGGVVYLHPFAEEMNKSRRMAALLSRKLASAGYAVLQIDLYGCGDSSGDLGDASWATWKSDVRLAIEWMRTRVDAPFYLWGLRLGTLLALDAAGDHAGQYAGLVLWQPVLLGETHLTQFLRLRVASEMMAEGVAGESTRALRGALRAGETVEIAGYDVPSRLAIDMDGLKLADLAVPRSTVHWFEVVSDSGTEVPIASRRAVETWASRGVDVRLHVVAGEPFWNTVEITDCAPLVDATVRAFDQLSA